MLTEIIDTHVHVWDLDKAEYTWLKGDTTLINRTFNLNELSEEHVSAGITGGVLVQSANNFEDTDWMLEVVLSHQWIRGVVGWLPLMECGRAEEAFAKRYKNNQYYKGVRHLIHIEPNDKWLLQEEVIESLKMLARYNLTLDVVGIIPEHIETVLKVAEKVPELRMVFDHINQPPISTKERFGRWGDLMKQASQHPNLYIKISGLGTASKNLTGWSTDDIKPYLDFAIGQFGEDRCFCGSDWPVSLLAGSYTNTWNIYRKALSELLDEDTLQKVLSQNAIKFYNL